MSKVRAIVMKSNDNVATVTEEIAAGSDILVEVDGTPQTIHVTEKIPFGHKVAIKKIAKEKLNCKFYANLSCSGERD